MPRSTTATSSSHGDVHVLGGGCSWVGDAGRWHGSLSALIWNADNTSATATFTAENSFAGTGSVQVVSFTDTTGNAGTGGSDTVSIDTANPSVTSVVFGVGDRHAQ